MDNDIERVLISEEQLNIKIKDLAAKISEDYKGKDLLVIGILKGAVVFFSDLIKNITIPMNIDFMAVSSYGNTTKSSGVVKFIKDLDNSIENRSILIVEDIIDTGLTLHYLVKNLESRKPESIKICCLLDKPSRRQVSIKPDYIGFEIPDEFVIGYGLDYNELYRNLPYIGVLKPSVYEK